MLEKERYNKILAKYGDVASWAIWKSPGDTPRSNTEDLSIFDDAHIIERLNPKYVFVGLNASSTHGKQVNQNKPWHNFHSAYARQNDYKLRYALMHTRFWGGYITDIIKRYPEVDSSKVREFLRRHPKVVESNIREFKEELDVLGGEPVLIAMGRAAYDILEKYLADDYRLAVITHYSYTIGKEEYRKQVLSSLRGY